MSTGSNPGIMVGRHRSGSNPADTKHGPSNVVISSRPKDPNAQTNESQTRLDRKSVLPDRASSGGDLARDRNGGSPVLLTTFNLRFYTLSFECWVKSSWMMMSCGTYEAFSSMPLMVAATSVSSKRWSGGETLGSAQYTHESHDASGSDLTQYLATALFGPKAPAPRSPCYSRVHCAAEHAAAPHRRKP